jgi:hypothetical protein
MLLRMRHDSWVTVLLRFFRFRLRSAPAVPRYDVMPRKSSDPTQIFVPFPCVRTDIYIPLRDHTLPAAELPHLLHTFLPHRFLPCSTHSSRSPFYAAFYTPHHTTFPIPRIFPPSLCGALSHKVQSYRPCLLPQGPVVLYWLDHWCVGNWKTGVSLSHRSAVVCWPAVDFCPVFGLTCAITSVWLILWFICYVLLCLLPELRILDLDPAYYFFYSLSTDPTSTSVYIVMEFALVEMVRMLSLFSLGTVFLARYNPPS